MNIELMFSLFKILFCFFLMLTGIRRGLGIGMSILLGSIVLGLLFGLDLQEWLQAAWLSLAEPKALLLMAIVALIMVLSEIMERGGQSRRLMDVLSPYFTSPRMRLVFFPALIGLLPMPGGAIFSAPLVKAAVPEGTATGEQLALVNYWFRHLWELIWPLYPGIILAAYLAGMPVLGMIAYTWPSWPVCIILGWLFYLSPKRLPLSRGQLADQGPVPGWTVCKEALPLLVALVGALGLEGVIWSLGSPVIPETGFVLALLLAVLCAAWQNAFSPGQVVSIFGKRHLLSMMLTIISIFVFKGVLDQGGVVQALAQGVGSGMGLLVLTVSLPLLVGMISGITLAFVGATFPLLIGIMEHINISDQLPYLVLAMFAGYAGVLGSPLHICFLLTCEFFHQDVPRVWVKLFVPCLLFLCFGVGYFFFLSLIFK